ncbi:MAG: dihydroxyacetone kinase subunit DhaL [Geminicoccaceae bacterium]
MAATIDPVALAAALPAVAAEVVAARDRLCALDGAIGDGDHGVTMALGWQAIADAVAPLDPAQAGFAGLLNTSAKAFLSATGGSAGPLYATALMRAAAVARDRPQLDGAGMAQLLRAAADGIAARGKATAGDKTMLDAWLPAAAAAEGAAAEGGDVGAVLAAAAAAAEAGAEATAAMQARLGRASRLGERSVGQPDPGAVSTALILRALERALG